MIPGEGSNSSHRFNFAQVEGDIMVRVPSVTLAVLVFHCPNEANLACADKQNTACAPFQNSQN
eukprot:2993921-Amphidinium_carterae.2